MAQDPTPFEYPALNETFPDSIRIGASSWTHQFWKGQIFHKKYKSEKEFNSYSLEEYAAYDLFTLVETDSTFYTPPKEETLEKYASLVPETFLFTAKVWERTSIPVYPNVKRYGKYAGQENDSFLDPTVFNEQFLPPFLNPVFKKKFAGFLIQFPRMEPTFATSRLLLSKLEKFLEAFPRNFRLAIEIRNKEILSTAYIALLNAHNVTHCFNHWHPMPSLLDQMKKIASLGGLSADFYMARLITPSGMKYEEAGTFMAPFFEIKRRDEQARADVVRIVKRAVQREVPAYIIVNNRFEGNSPCTIREVREQLESAIIGQPLPKDGGCYEDK